MIPGGGMFPPAAGRPLTSGRSDMGRAIWSGVISFGLVSVPVELYSATKAHEPRFHQLQKGTPDRVRYQRVNERTRDAVEYSDVVKGADIGGGKYVMLDQEDLNAVAPGRSRSLDIHTFVDLGDIDPIYFNKAFFLGPGGKEWKKTYALLRDAMAHSGKAAIASFVMRSREYLAAVRADGDVLVLETLFFADEIRDPHDEIGNLPGRVELSPQELRMAGQLIDAMTGPWDLSQYRDTYTDRLNDLIEAKKRHKQFKAADESPPTTNADGLADALKASLNAARKPPARKPSAKEAAAGKKTSATRTTAKKPSNKGAA
jgi:DNA end-binding protein Ku